MTIMSAVSFDKSNTHESKLLRRHVVMKTIAKVNIHRILRASRAHLT